MSLRREFIPALREHIAGLVPATSEAVNEAIDHWRDGLEPAHPLEAGIFGVCFQVARDMDAREQGGAGPVPSTEVLIEAVERSMTTTDNPGFCTVCGEEASGVEPDATGYKCEACGERAVSGAEQLMLERGAM